MQHERPRRCARSSVGQRHGRQFRAFVLPETELGPPPEHHAGDDAASARDRRYRLTGAFGLSHDRQLFFRREAAAGLLLRHPRFTVRCGCQAGFGDAIVSTTLSTSAYRRAGARMKMGAPVDLNLAALEKIAPAPQADRRDPMRGGVMCGRRSAPGHRFDVHRPERLNGDRPLRCAQPGCPGFARRMRLMLHDDCVANDGQPPPERAHIEPMLLAIALPRKTAATPRLDVDRPLRPPSCVLEMFRTHRRSSSARRNPIWTANALPIRCARTARLRSDVSVRVLHFSQFLTGFPAFHAHGSNSPRRLIGYPSTIRVSTSHK